MGSGRDVLLRPGLVLRASRLIRRRCRRGRACRPQGGCHRAADGRAGMIGDIARPATATDRLQRLLALVPYVVSRKVVGLAETAAAFDISERQLVDDLNMLWCVELRSPDPYCPIHLAYAEAVERRAHGPALRVENGGLRCDEYASSHGNSNYRMPGSLQANVRTALRLAGRQPPGSPGARRKSATTRGG